MQSIPQEVKYVQYMIYAISLLYLVVEIIEQLPEIMRFSFSVWPIVGCVVGYIVGRDIRRLDSVARLLVIVWASLTLLPNVAFVVQQVFGFSLSTSIDPPLSINPYVYAGFFVLFDVLLLYLLMRPHVREAFRQQRALVVQQERSGVKEDGAQDEA